MKIERDLFSASDWDKARQELNRAWDGKNWGKLLPLSRQMDDQQCVLWQKNAPSEKRAGEAL